MSKRGPLTILLFLMATLAMGGFPGAASPGKGTKAPRAQAAPAAAAISHNDSLRFKVFYLEAIKQQVDGNYDAAYNILSHCLEINPGAAEAYFMLSLYDGILRGDSAALADMETAASLNPENDIYLERLGTEYLRTRNLMEAVAAYEKLSRNRPDRSDILDILIQLYGQGKDHDKTLDAILRLEALEGSSEETALAKMRVYSMQGRKDDELKALDDLCAQHPYDMGYRVMMGNWLLQNGKADEAYGEYLHALEQDPENASAQMSLIDYFKKVGDAERADSIQEVLLLNPRTPTESKVLLMRMAVTDSESAGGDSTRVLGMFRKIVSQPQETADLVELYASYMVLKGMPQDSINAAYRMVLGIEPDNVTARLRLIQDAWSRQDFAQVEAMSAQAVDYNPEELVFHYFLGLAHVQQDDDDKAIEALRRGVGMADEDESDGQLVSDLYALLGDLLHGKGLSREAYAAYESSLEWNDENVSCLNNYAYYLSEEDVDLPKAERMSYRTIQAEPSNSTYLDTFAWILFKQGRYPEALQYIDMAVDNDSTGSAIIMEHAGDIHAASGDTDGAVERWLKALEMGPDDEATLGRKIKQGKYTNGE